MEYLEGLKKAGVVGMFIGPDPSTVLRLIVVKGDREEFHDANEMEYREYFEYFEQIRNGNILIPEEFKVTVKVKELVEEPSIIDGIYKLNNLEKIILDQYINPFEYDSSTSVWEAIKESAFDLNGKTLALYLRTSFLYLSELRNDVKNDIALRREVEERLNIDGETLNGEVNPNREVGQSVNYSDSGIEYETLKKEIIDLKNIIANSDQVIISNLSEIQKTIIDLSIKLSAKIDIKNKTLSKDLNGLKNSVIDVNQILTSNHSTLNHTMDNLSQKFNDKENSEKNLLLDELKNLKNIMDKITDAGLSIMLYSSELDKARMCVMIYLRSKYGSIKVTPRNLHNLDYRIKQELRDYLMLNYGNAIHGKQICDNIFRAPRRNLRKNENIEYYR